MERRREKPPAEKPPAPGGSWMEYKFVSEFSARHSNVIMVKELSSKEEFDKIVSESGDKLVAVDYTASWCG